MNTFPMQSFNTLLNYSFMMGGMFVMIDIINAVLLNLYIWIMGVYQ